MSISVAVLLVSGCKKNDVNNLSIGQSYQGGYIAYFLQQGDPGYDPNVRHGLIAAPYDQSTGATWWNGTSVTTHATGLAIGAGRANTDSIIAHQGAGNYAASICAALTFGGYTDWYLPSENELNQLYLNRVAIGGFYTYSYWSSSEYSNTGAWYQDFIEGDQGYDVKSPTRAVRAVRAF